MWLALKENIRIWHHNEKRGINTALEAKTSSKSAKRNISGGVAKIWRNKRIGDIAESYG